MTNVTLRRARPEDAQKLAEVHMTARRVSIPFLAHLHSDEETVRWMSELVLPAMEVWVAEAAESFPGHSVTNEIAGYLALEDELIDQLYILPQWQGRGVATLLLEKARQVRPEALRLYCFAMNAPARAFYEARGFVPIEFTDGERNEEKLPDVLYRWVARS